MTPIDDHWNQPPSKPEACPIEDVEMRVKRTAFPMGGPTLQFGDGPPIPLDPEVPIEISTQFDDEIRTLRDAGCEVTMKVVEEATVKDSNPKDAVGIKKAPLSTVSAPVMMEVGVAMMEGALKYGRHNYRAIGVRASVYYDALMRHIMAWWEGEDIDEESGLSHITKAIACLMVQRDAMIRDKMVDDRPVGTEGFVKHLNSVAAALMEKYPNPKDAFTADGQEPEEYLP